MAGNSHSSNRSLRTTGQDKSQKVRTNRRTWLIALGLPVAVAVVWFGFTSKQSSAAASAAASLELAQDGLNAYQSKLTALQSGQAPSAGALLLTARALDEQLPPSIGSIDAINMINTAATSAGVTLSNSTPDATAGETSKSFSLSVNGPKANVLQFMTALTQSSPLMTITNVNMTFANSQSTTTAPSGSTQGDTSATFKVTVWFYGDNPLDGPASGGTPGAVPGAVPTDAPAAPTGTVTAPLPPPTNAPSGGAAPLSNPLAPNGAGGAPKSNFTTPQPASSASVNP